MSLSLRTKTVLIMIAFALMLAATSVLISYRTYSQTMDEHYKALASNIAKTAASQMNGDVLDAYLDVSEKIKQISPEEYARMRREKTSEYFALFPDNIDAEYARMLKILYDIKINNDVKYLYIEKLTGEPGAYEAIYIMDADSLEENPSEACPLGDWYELDEANIPYMTKLEGGIPSFMTYWPNSYGWLVTSGEPIFDSKGDVAAMMFTDISMDDVMADRQAYLRFVAIFLAAVTVTMVAIVILFITRTVVSPINRLSKATEGFVESQEHGGESDISKLKVRSKDEIGRLTSSVKLMEVDIKQYIESLTAVTAEKERIGAELAVATNIQASMLPRIFPPFPDREEFDLFASMHPAKEVGGDFYDFFLIDNDHLALVMADVSGKGVPAALFMVIAKTLIKNQAQSGMAANDVFTNVNGQLCENNDSGLFVTAWMGMLQISTGRFTFVNAGHNPPLLMRAGENFKYLKTSAGFVLAGMEGIKYKLVETTINKGDKLFLYTDGVTEAMNEKNELYGETRLNEVLDKNKGAGVEDIVQCVKLDVNAFAGTAPQADDITMLCLEMKGN